LSQFSAVGVAKVPLPMTKNNATNNQRIARMIIVSNTNRTQRDSLLWLQDIESAIVRALNGKDEACVRSIVAKAESVTQG
jgi:hypothetical protein